MNKIKRILDFKLLFTVSISFFIVLTIFYTSNPYYLLRPLQISENEGIRPKISSPNIQDIKPLNNRISRLMSHPISEGYNFTVTRKSRINKFLRSIGNCSQNSTGLGLVLDSLGYKYSIIHFLPKKGLFEGSGHTILNVIVDTCSLLVDPMFKIFPVIEKEIKTFRYINKSDLKNKANILFMNGENIVKQRERYWSNKFSTVYAEVSHNSMHKHFKNNERFVNLLGLKESRFNRLLINGISAATFNLPSFRLSSEDYDKLCHQYPKFKKLKFIAFLYIVNFWLMLILIFTNLFGLIIQALKSYHK
jgi:hypothetical protein